MPPAWESLPVRPARTVSTARIVIRVAGVAECVKNEDRADNLQKLLQLVGDQVEVRRRLESTPRAGVAEFVKNEDRADNLQKLLQLAGDQVEVRRRLEPTPRAGGGGSCGVCKK